MGLMRKIREITGGNKDFQVYITSEVIPDLNLSFMLGSRQEWDLSGEQRFFKEALIRKYLPKECPSSYYEYASGPMRKMYHALQEIILSNLAGQDIDDRISDILYPDEEDSSTVS